MDEILTLFLLVRRTVDLGTALRVGEGGGGYHLTPGWSPGQTAPGDGLSSSGWLVVGGGMPATIVTGLTKNKISNL